MTMPADMITGVARYAGWRRKDKRERFVVEIELPEAPGWPIDVVWKQMPITLSIELPAAKTTEDAR
jgi:hypothetical protein